VAVHGGITVNTYQTEYLSVWKQAFAKLLSWSAEQTTSWAQPLLAMMDPPGMIINEPPLYYVAREIAWQQSFFEKLPQRRRSELIREIQNILDPNHSRTFECNFDFKAAKIRIDMLLRGAKAGR
jgi:hypothetical protein